MKSMGDDSNNNNNNSNNWLGFSLSPHMKMDLSSAASSALPTSFYHVNNSSFSYEVGSHNSQHAVFHPPLTVMPLKSDGSLCILEALSSSHSHGMVQNNSPKLENFLGGRSAMDANDYEKHQTEAMALSLDSIIYHNHHPQQNAEPDTKWIYSDDFIYPTSPHQEQGTKQTPQPFLPHSDNQSHVAKHSWFYSSPPYSLDHQQHQIGTQLVDDVSSGGQMGSCSELQTLTLSMSPGSLSSSCVTASRRISPTGTESLVPIETKKRGSAKIASKQTVHRKSLDTFGQRTSQFRGVTRHRWTGRYEAHLWDNSCKKEGQTRKGRQVYLGGYDMEEKAARAYDQAALKYWGPSTHINFPLENYEAELETMKNMTRQDFVAHLRRKSSGFSRGASIYRGVTRHHQHGRWQARIGRVAGNKDLYLGTFSSQEEAAEAYDVAAIKFRGANAVTNFDISKYDVEKISASNTLLAGELARRIKDSHHTTETIDHTRHTVESNGNGDQRKMVLYHSQDQDQDQDQQNACVDPLYEKTMTINGGNNFNLTQFSQGLIGMNESDKVESNNNKHSNPSSLTSSLTCSREGSPDKTKAGGGSVGCLWITSDVAPISMSQLPPGFAAWGDA